MFSRSSLLHLRIPFSYFLLPVFLLALSTSPNFNGARVFWVFFIVHFLLYPASNGYNSYFDKDEASIGGLKNPPPTEKGLYFLALLLDAAAIILGYIFINPTFAVMLLTYGLVSKAYSHPSIRLKKHAVTSLLLTGIFQGLFTFVMCYIGINDYSLSSAMQPKILAPGLLASIMLMANYPITQVYQHREDARRGDITLSIRLGIRGTFYFAAVVFGVGMAGFLLYLYYFHGALYSWAFLVAVLPILIYFFYWLLLVIVDEKAANYSHTMSMNLVSSTCLGAFFIFLFLRSSQVLQLL